MQFISETENLHRLTRFGMFNCFLVREGQELTLVDSSCPGSGDVILRAASALRCPDYENRPHPRPLFLFPMPGLFSWNPALAARGAAKLAALKPSRLAVGHGKTIVSPTAQMDRAVEIALRQHPQGADFQK
jgi:hypothetical protein